MLKLHSIAPEDEPHAGGRSAFCIDFYPDDLVRDRRAELE